MKTSKTFLFRINEIEFNRLKKLANEEVIQLDRQIHGKRNSMSINN